MNPFNQQTRSKMAACQALGLSYWSDHPARGCLWAVDANQQAHVVRWYRKTNQAALQQIGKPRKVIDYTQVGCIVYRDQYPTHDAAERVAIPT